MSDERDDDPDREAILARRRKLIAVALAGLTSAAGCEEAEPQVCLAPTVQEGRETTLTPIDRPKDDPTETEEAGETVEGEDGESGAEGESGESTQAGGAQTGAQPAGTETGMQTATPQACLRRSVPRPCLRARPPDMRQPVPQPCLEFVLPREEQPPPQACLTPARKPSGEPDDDLG